jgi:hypothetical protein
MSHRNTPSTVVFVIYLDDILMSFSMICFFASPATGEVVAAIEDADFNQDGNVDGNDFLTW